MAFYASVIHLMIEFKYFRKLAEEKTDQTDTLNKNVTPFNVDAGLYG